jgi:non-ribosomal peptide synthetase component F
LHPGFTESLDAASNRGSGASSLGDRLDRVLNTLGGYLTGHAVRHGKVVAILMLLALAAFVVLRRRAGEWELPFLAV